MTVREPESVTQARRALGAELAAYRRAARLTQAKLAQLTGCSRSTIANVETGHQRVARDLWERADDALRTGGVLATGHDDVEAVTQRELHAAAHTASATRQAARSQHPGTHSGAVAQGPAFAPGLPELATAPAEAHNVARLHSMRLHLKSIDNAHGGGAVLPMAAWYTRHEITPLLNAAQPAPSAALLDVAAQFYCDTGGAAYDAGQPTAATTYFTTALRLAHRSSNRLLSGRILTAMSHQAIHLGHLQQAIDFAHAAQTATRHLTSPRATAMLAAMQACAHAAAGEAHPAQQALDRAAYALTMITHSEPDPDWLDFDEGGYWGHAARAYRDLGYAHQAEQCAAKSIGLCLTGHSRTRAQRNTIQATAHLHLGEIDAAAAAGLRVVNDAWNLHSGHVFGEVTHLLAEIEPHGGPEAKEFTAQARELLAARAPATLPPD